MRGHLIKLCQSGAEIRIVQGIRELAIVGHYGIVDCGGLNRNPCSMEYSSSGKMSQRIIRIDVIVESWFL